MTLYTMIIIIIGIGSSNVPAVHSQEFFTMENCQSASKEFNELKWIDNRVNYKTSFCVKK